MTSVEYLPNRHLESQSEKKVNIDFGDQRRHSFLPDNWSEGKPEASVKNIKVIDIKEDEDDLYLYMQSDYIYTEKPLEKFCTGSKYLGQWNKLGIAGKGVYKYPHGVIYDGYFNRNGEFHGNGILVYPNGQRIEGTWRNGKLGPDCNFVAKAGVVMNKNYCLMPDRRFQVEIENDFNPVGQEYLTDQIPPPRKIPEGCFDVVEGFFDPQIKTVIGFPKHDHLPTESRKTVKEKKSPKPLFDGDERRSSAFSAVSGYTESEANLETLMKHSCIESKKAISWIPSAVQEEWIMKNCRKAWDESTGYRPDLYEEWTKGDINGVAVESIEHIDSKCNLRALKLHEEEQQNQTYSGIQDNLNILVDSILKHISKKYCGIYEEAGGGLTVVNKKWLTPFKNKVL